MICVSDLRVAVGSRVLVDRAAFDVRGGCFIGVLGRNGVGKTTLLRTLAGVRKAAAGSIRIAGRPIGEFSSARRAQLIAHIAGDDLFSDRLAVRDVVAMGRYAHHRWWQWHEHARDEVAISTALRDVGMHAFQSRLFDTLSSGERQRVWLALALAQQAPILLLDEPTSHLDVRVAHDILELLRAQARAGKIVICALHDLNEAAVFADRILLLAEGRVLAFDSPENVLSSHLLQEAYGIEMELLRTPSGALRVFPAHETYQRSRVSATPGP